jgi:hypothetical protein
MERAVIREMLLSNACCDPRFESHPDSKNPNILFRIAFWTRHDYLHYLKAKTLLLIRILGTVPGRQGRQKIIPQKNVEKINKFIKYFVEINKKEVKKKL